MWPEHPKKTWCNGLLKVGKEHRNSSRPWVSGRSAFKTSTCHTCGVTQTKVHSPSELRTFICQTGRTKQQLYSEKGSGELPWCLWGLGSPWALCLGAQGILPLSSVFHSPPPLQMEASPSRAQKHKRWPREKGNTSSVFWGRLSLNEMQNLFSTKRRRFRKLPLQVCLETKISDLQKLRMQIP